MIGKVIQQISEGGRLGTEVLPQDIVEYMAGWDSLLADLPGYDIDYAEIKGRIRSLPGQVSVNTYPDALAVATDITKIWLERRVRDLYKADIAMVPLEPDSTFEELHSGIENSVAFCDVVRVSDEFIDIPERFSLKRIEGVEMWPIDQAKGYLSMINALEFHMKDGYQNATQFVLSELNSVADNIESLFRQSVTNKTPNHLDDPLQISEEAENALRKQFKQDNPQLYDLKNGLLAIVRLLDQAAKEA